MVVASSEIEHPPRSHARTDQQLFGPLPVHPEGPCVEACSKFGSSAPFFYLLILLHSTGSVPARRTLTAACAGAVYSPKTRRCALQGLNTVSWEFQRGSQADSTNLIGGCALWSHIGERHNLPGGRHPSSNYTHAQCQNRWTGCVVLIEKVNSRSCQSSMFLRFWTFGLFDLDTLRRSGPVPCMLFMMSISMLYIQTIHA